jgi:hypothetical protein
MSFTERLNKRLEGFEAEAKVLAERSEKLIDVGGEREKETIALVERWKELEPRYEASSGELKRAVLTTTTLFLSKDNISSNKDVEKTLDSDDCESDSDHIAGNSGDASIESGDDDVEDHTRKDQENPKIFLQGSGIFIPFPFLEKEITVTTPSITYRISAFPTKKAE